MTPIPFPPKNSATNNPDIINALIWLVSLNKAKYNPLYSTKGPSQISVSASAISNGTTPTSAGITIKKAMAAGINVI